MKVLIIDNYDSFTFNLYQYVGELLSAKEKNFVLDVLRNDEVSFVEIKKRNYDKIIISPGSGDPSNKAYFGVCAEVITKLGEKTSILGVCLGMQGIAHCFGGKVIRAKKPMHGKTSIIKHDAKGVFKDIPQDIEAMRYHSLIVERKNLPEDLGVTAVVAPHPRPLPKGEGLGEGEIMGLRHKRYPIEGIQFHPESFATEAGKLILSNFLFNTLSSRATGGSRGISYYIRGSLV